MCRVITSAASSNTKPLIRVLLADDHPLILAALCQALTFEHDMTVIGEATNGDEVQQLAALQQPDVLLMDLILPGPSPQAIITHVRKCSPRTKIVVLSAYADEAHMQNLLELGTVGYILKNEGGQAIIDAVRTVTRNGTWFSQSVLKNLAKRSSDTQGQVEVLTGREREVLEMVARGFDNREIASMLNISIRTVKYHIQNIYSKLNVDSRARAISLVWQRGIIESQQPR